MYTHRSFRTSESNLGGKKYAAHHIRIAICIWYYNFVPTQFCTTKIKLCTLPFSRTHESNLKEEEYTMGKMNDREWISVCKSRPFVRSMSPAPKSDVLILCNYVHRMPNIVHPLFPHYSSFQIQRWRPISKFWKVVLTRTPSEGH